MTEKNEYKEVELGPIVFQVPDHWSLTSVNKISQKVTDGTHSTPEYTDTGIPFLSTKNLNPFRKKFDFSEYEKFITKEDHKKLASRCNPEIGDILLSKCGTIGRTQKIREGFEFNIFVGLALIKPEKNKVSSNYLEQFFNFSTIESILQIKAPGSTRKTLTINAIKNQEVLLPPLPEQKKIAEVLSTVDDAIQKTEEIIERTKKLKKGMMQDLLTEGIGYEDFKEVQLGPKKVTIPSDWVLKPLQEILKKEESGVWGDDPEEGSGVPVLRATNYGEYGIDLEEDTAKRSISNSKDGKKLEKGDIVLERSGGSPYQPVGRVLYFDLEGEFYPGNFLQLLRPDPAKIDPKFLFYRLDYIYEKGDTLTMQTRTTNIRNLQYNLYLAQKVPIPPITEQKQIADALSTVDQKIQQEQNYKEKLEELKKGLMQDLLTGKVRVLPLLSEEKKEELKEANVPG